MSNSSAGRAAAAAVFLSAGPAGRTHGLTIATFARDGPDAMQRQSVPSTSILSVGYDGAAHRLEIEFHGGRVYQYEHVPAAAYRLLLQAPSIGEYVNSVIKPRFKATRV